MKKEKIVFVHGIFDSGIVFSPMTKYFSKLGYETYSPSLQPNSAKHGIDDLSKKLSIYINSIIQKDEKVILIGFSLGGLVCRHYLQRLDGLKSVKKFISISSPHKGSFLAFLLWHKGGEQLRPRSTFIKDLLTDTDLLLQVNFTSIWTPYDMMIIPANSSSLSMGKEIKIPILIHAYMLISKKLLRILANEIENLASQTISPT